MWKELGLNLELHDGLMSIADCYFSIDCSCFSPNTERLESIARLAEEYRVDGVIQNILQYCYSYNIEARACFFNRKYGKEM